MMAGREFVRSSIRLIAKYWHGLAVLVAVPSFIIAIIGYFDIGPLAPWQEQQPEPTLQLSIRVAEHVGPSTGTPGVALPEPSAFHKDVNVSEGATVIFAVLVSFEPELAAEESPLVLRFDLPEAENSLHQVRVSVGTPDGRSAETAIATVSLQGGPACLVYTPDTTQFMATIEGSVLETLPDVRRTSPLVEGLEGVVGFISEWGVSDGILLLEARILQNPQGSAEFVERRPSRCLPTSFDYIALLD